MSLVDKFHDPIEPAFTRDFDPESARRQFRVSLILVGAMALAAFVLGFALPVSNSHTATSAPIAADSSGFTGRLVTVSDH